MPAPEKPPGLFPALCFFVSSDNLPERTAKSLLTQGGMLTGFDVELLTTSRFLFVFALPHKRRSHTQQGRNFPSGRFVGEKSLPCPPRAEADAAAGSRPRRAMRSQDGLGCMEFRCGPAAFLMAGNRNAKRYHNNQDRAWAALLSRRPGTSRRVNI